MKTVFSNGMVAHVWAQQDQCEGKNSDRTFFFENETIYSFGYHFPIAKFLDKKTVLFTSRTYSNATGGHQHTARQAVHDNVDLIFADNIDIELDSKHLHKQNVSIMEKEINDLLGRATRAVKNAKWLKDAAIKKIGNREKYSMFFKLYLPTFTISDKIETLIEKKIERAEVNEKNFEENQRKKSKDFIDKMDKQYSGIDGLRSKWIKKEQLNSDDKKYLSLIAPGYPVWLRVSTSGEKIETSSYAEVSFNRGMVMIDYVLDNVPTEGFKQVSKRIDHFTLSEIHTDHVIIGCHKISIEEIKRFRDSQLRTA